MYRELGQKYEDHERRFVVDKKLRNVLKDLGEGEVGEEVEVDGRCH